MPTYEFGCLDCGTKFDVFASISQKEKGLKLVCPDCGGSNAVQLFNSVNFITQGSSSTSSGSSACAGCSGTKGCCS